MNIRIIFITIFVIITSLYCYPGEPDQLDELPDNDTIELPSSAVKWYTELQLANPAIAEPNFVDTTLRGFQKYDFTYRERMFFAHRGNVGHPTRNLVFEPVPTKGKFSYLKDDIYSSNLFSHDNIRYYRPEHVFTDLFYVTGGDNEQLFYALHSQRLSEQMVLSFKYQVVRAPGLYSRMESNNANFYSSFDFVSEDERYQLLGSFVSNRMRGQESGGLINPEGFEEDEVQDSVYLFNSVGGYSETAVNIHHYYQLGFYRDVEENEDNEVSQRFVNFGRLSHNASYSRKSFIYEDNTTPYHGFFEGFKRLDSAQTYDSTIVHNVYNRVGYSNYRFAEGRSRFPLFFHIYLEHNYYDIHMPLDITYSFNQLTQGVDLHSDRQYLLSFNGFYDYTFGGYNDNDLSIGGSIRFGEFGKIDNWFEVDAAYYERESPYIMNDFISNYVEWENSFNKIKIAKAGFNYGNEFLSLSLDAFYLTDWVYFNREAESQQADYPFFVTSAGLQSSISTGVFGIDNHLVYQFLLDDRYEQFPGLVSYTSLYADLVLFDKALYTRIGIDAKYNSPYYAQSYMPVHKQFYIQDEYETPHHIFLDVYINAKISRARLFLKYRNLGSLLWDQKPIYMIPYYPLPEEEVRFGVSWMFHD